MITGDSASARRTLSARLVISVGMDFTIIRFVKDVTAIPLDLSLRLADVGRFKVSFSDTNLFQRGLFVTALLLV